MQINILDTKFRANPLTSKTIYIWEKALVNSNIDKNNKRSTGIVCKVFGVRSY